MQEIIKGTTPVLKFTFSTVDPADISTAYLTIKDMNKNVILSVDNSGASTGADYIAWELTQAQSLLLPVDENVAAMCDWLLNDGTRGRSEIVVYTVGDTGKNEVMS